MIRVVIAEDHHLVRQGIQALLEKAHDIEVVGEAANGQQALEQVARHYPDVVLMDLAMPHLSGLEAIERIHTLDVETNIVVLSMHSDETLVREALRKGAKGYLLKRSVTEELLLAIRAAVRGQIYLSPMVSRAVLDDFFAHPSKSEQGGIERLTPREREVLQLIAEGHTNNTIAHHMGVSVKTVEKHRANLMAKLDMHDVAGLTRLAIKHGLVFLDH
jgi:DNA-binding NarL/FixJ family response regulator